MGKEKIAAERGEGRWLHDAHAARLIVHAMVARLSGEIIEYVVYLH